MHYNNYYYYESSAAGSGAAWWSSSYKAPAAKRSVSSSLERIEGMASANAVVIFSVSTCCMCHAVKRLFWGMGVNPTVYEIDQDPSGHDLHAALLRLLRCGASSSSLPVVFIGGRLVGAMDSVMASHISGALVPLLKDAGALWL